MARHFTSTRGGGQAINVGYADRHYLRAYFLEKSPDLQTIRALIDRNRQVAGWLVLATHDVDERPTPFGCTPAFFDEVVRYAVESGARILPVRHALESLEVAGASLPSRTTESARSNLQSRPGAAAPAPTCLPVSV